MKIQCHSEDLTSRFAAKELTSYLTRMGYPELEYTLTVADLSSYGLPAVDDPSLDDQYYICVTEQTQQISGNNPRSLLLAVYRYLTLLGCRFLRPGKEYEIVPALTAPSQYYAQESHTASLRHRGACIEGADSIENILDFIDWSPKVGFNSFFMQFKYPHTFLERWYRHQNNPLIQPIDWTIEDSARLMPAFNEAMARRGLLQHRVGHGWTSEALGCTATGWDAEAVSFSPETQAMIAEVGGKRELFGGVPTNTNLCLTNPAVIDRFTDLVLSYVADNPDTDYLHIWLADDSNNSCECPRCRELRPSDHYVELLNHLDEKLTEAGSSVKLVLLLYFDLLWAPVQARLQNPERFALMFAPITRTFETSFADRGEPQDPPEFRLNQMKFPQDIETNLAFLKAWQQAAPCDSFIYDYPLGRAHFGDPAYLRIARLIYRDLQSNRAMGLNGISSCQELRAFFPNGLPNYIMARSSDDLSLSFEQIAAEYYDAAYGPAGASLLPLMERVSQLFSPDYLIGIGDRLNPELAARMRQIPDVLEQIRGVMGRRTPDQTSVQTRMWQEIEFFLDYTKTLALATQLLAEGQTEESRDVYEHQYKELIRRHETVDQGGLDVYRIQLILNRNTGWR